MVIKGRARSGAAKLAAHLARTDTNEHMEVIEVRGMLAADLYGALIEMEAVASGSRTERPLYHASLNTRADEVLTPEQRDHAIDRLEAALGLTDQPRVVVAHVKEGRAHHHVVWSRIDLADMTAISDSFNYRRHEECARELEREFGHARVQGAHAERDGQARPDRTPSHAEMQQAERHGYSPAEMKAAVTELWQTADNGQALAAAIAEQGWILARGDRRDFVIVDEFGEAHSLARRIDGAKAKDVRERCADIDPATLPSVAEARTFQTEREARRTATDGQAAGIAKSQAPENSQVIKPFTNDQAAEQAQRLVTMLEEAERQQQTRQFTAQAAQATQSTPRPEQPVQDDQAAKQPQREAALLQQAEQQATERKALQDEADRIAKEARRQEAERISAGTVTNAESRYAEALGEKYDVLRPYQSLAQAAMAEYGKFAKEQEQLRLAAGKEADPAARQLIELRRQIEAADYMAITSERIARIGNVVAGHDTEQAARDRTAAKEWAAKSQELRTVRAEMIHTRDERQRDATPAAKNDDIQEAARKRHNEAMTAPGATPTNRAEQKPYDAKTASPAEQAAKRAAEIERMRKIREQQKERQRQNSRGGNSL